MSLEEFHNKKPIETVKRVGIKLTHSDITTQYLIHDIVNTASLSDGTGTRTWTGVNMRIARPVAGRVSVSIGRVGTQVYQQIKNITGFGRMEPVELTMYEWLSPSTIPAYSVTLSVEDISMTIDGVTITASEVNEATLRVAERYTIAKFPGLEFA
ncbi:MAG: hypothetical protein VW258_09365 [Thalassolituus sp.]